MTRGIKFGLLLLLLLLVASIPLAMQLETGAIEGVVIMTGDRSPRSQWKRAT